jgi:hypothetical protein
MNNTFKLTLDQIKILVQNDINFLDQIFCDDFHKILEQVAKVIIQTSDKNKILAIKRLRDWSRNYFKTNPFPLDSPEIWSGGCGIDATLTLLFSKQTIEKYWDEFW